MPHVEEIFENAKVISILYLAKGYGQIPLEAVSREKTPFATLFGLYEFEVMPFAPSDFLEDDQSYAEGCILFSRSYMDDIAIYSQSYHMARMFLKEIFV